MKKIGYILFAICWCQFSLQAQITQQELDNAQQEVKESKKDKKKKEAAYQALLDSAMYQNALISLENNDFVLEAEKITFKRGRWRYVTANTNFISLKEDKATVQIAFEGPRSGPNGIGGITVEGRISNVKRSIDKKGNTHLSMQVSGIAITAMVNIILRKGSHKATATVAPMFSSNHFTMDGYIWPTSQSNVYKGRSL